MAPLLKFSISLILVATSALLVLENSGVFAVAVPPHALDLATVIQPDFVTAEEHSTAPTATLPLVPIGISSAPAPAVKEQHPSIDEPIANGDTKNPAKGPEMPMSPIHQRPYKFPPPSRPHENVVENQKRAQQSPQWGQWGQQQWGDQSQLPTQQSQWPGQQSQWPGQQPQWPSQSQWGSTPSFGSHLSQPKKRAVTDDQDPSRADTSASAFNHAGTSPMTPLSSGYLSPAGRLPRNSILCHYDPQNKNTIYCSDGRVYETPRGRPPRDIYQGQALTKRTVGVQPPQPLGGHFVTTPNVMQPYQPQHAPKTMNEQHTKLGGTAPSLQKRLDIDNTVWSDFYATVPETAGSQKYAGGGGHGGGYGGGQGSWDKGKDWDKKHKNWKRQYGGAPGGPSLASGPGFGFGAGFGGAVGAGFGAGPGAGGVGPGPAAGSRPYSTAIPVPIDINTLVYPDGQMVLLPPNA